jgi:hypothetical protein
LNNVLGIKGLKFYLLKLACNSLHPLYTSKIHRNLFYNFDFILNKNSEYHNFKRSVNDIKDVDLIKKYYSNNVSSNKLYELENLFSILAPPLKHITSHKGVKSTNFMLITENYKKNDWKLMNEFLISNKNCSITLNLKDIDNKSTIYQHFDIDDWDIVHSLLLNFQNLKSYERDLIFYYEKFNFYLELGIYNEDIIINLLYNYLNYKIILLTNYSDEVYLKIWHYKLKSILDSNLFNNILVELVYILYKVGNHIINDKMFEAKHKSNN